jgi:hypothetical protein
MAKVRSRTLVIDASRSGSGSLALLLTNISRRLLTRIAT